jgi:hypothetical protein
VYEAPSAFAGYCAAPRTGTDPVTGQAYTDKLGSATWENNWLRAWTNAYYLWYSEVPDVNPANDTTPAYFDLMKTTALTPAGRPKDRFHFTYATTTWEELSQAGQNVGYGVTWDVLAPTPPRNITAALVQAGTPAAIAGVTRGSTVLEVDGINAVTAPDQASVDALNAALSPSAAGTPHTFKLQDVAGNVTTVTLTSAAIDENPVPTVATFPQSGGGVVGYIEFDAHIATAESLLIAAFNKLAAASVTDLVLDIRYNGGGYLDLASEVAYMIAGAAQTAGATFELSEFNAKYPTTDPITGQSLTPTPFYSVSQGLSTNAGTSLPSLNLKRVFVLTTANTCSASESIINSLRGIGVNVIEVGSTTCGKPYGFYPQDNCGTTYFSIQFQGVNNVGFGNYPDGFTPQNSGTAASVSLPGCAVADDFAHAMGDPNEAQFAAALQYLSTATCPAVTAAALKRLHTAGQARLVRPEALLNRILRNH